jgi:uncharacterized protein
MELQQIADELNNPLASTNTGLEFTAAMLAGDANVLQVTVEGREELPIFVSVTEEQVLCISYLWGADEVKPESLNEMHTAMLEMNIPMPLSSFSKIGDKYAVFGAMSISSSIDDIAHELAVLSCNSMDVISEMSDFLV